MDSHIVVNIELRKHFIRAMQEPVAREHIVSIISETSTEKWKLELVNDMEGSTNWYRTFGNYPTEVALYFRLTGPVGPQSDVERDARLSALNSAAQGTKSQKRNWKLHSVDGEAWKPLTIEQEIERRNRPEGTVTYADVQLPSVELQRVAFRDLYGIDSQIARIVTSMKRSIETEFKYRSHGLLIGPPGCGKSQTLMNAKEMFGRDAVLVIDGTSMTSAGIIDTLKELETMPRFIFIEEIDKAPADAVSVLLGLMDKHGEIRKNTYREKFSKEGRVCVFATANSLQKIRNMSDGAVLSRFGNPITYNRPSRDMLQMILHRELDSIGVQMCQKPVPVKGDDKRTLPCGKCAPCKVRLSWIKVTLDWCDKFHEILEADTYDPRFVIDMCLNGQNDLLNNQYTDILEATSIKKADVEDWD